MTGPLCTGILDVHHADGAVDAAAMKAGGITALIHKATQGKDWRDPAFVATVTRARDAGLLVGAYHFASGSSGGAQQADYFLSVAGPDVLLALDWESNPNATSGDMTPDNARRFVERVREVTGRWPLFYSGASRLRSLNLHAGDVLGNCPLWIAQYGEAPKAVPAAWPAWSLWQYSDVGYGPADRRMYPRDTPGVRVADRSCFRGTAAELAAWWQTCGR